MTIIGDVPGIVIEAVGTACGAGLIATCGRIGGRKGWRGAVTVGSSGESVARGQPSHAVTVGSSAAESVVKGQSSAVATARLSAVSGERRAQSVARSGVSSAVSGATPRSGLASVAPTKDKSASNVESRAARDQRGVRALE
jgi:hypothetical protein